MGTPPQLVGNMSAVTAPGASLSSPGELSLMLGEKAHEPTSGKITEIEEETSEIPDH